MMPARVGCSLRWVWPASVLLLCACAERQETGTRVAETDSTPQYVGSEACASCHSSEFELWLASHHELAMQPATASTVSGDFNGAEFDYFGETSRFVTVGDAFIVETTGPDGQLARYEVDWVFGIEPLEQYLVEFPGGRLQALPLAWDTRPESDGGQRWFHLYPDEHIAPGDELHWTGPQQNWNYMCAECHSTNVKLNYDVASDSFSTTYDELSVGCEACHGPGSVHVTQAEAGEFVSSRRGLVVDLDDQGRATWQMNPETGIAERSEISMRVPQQPETCGRCHARRGYNSAAYEHGKRLADSHLPALLDAGLYFDDGQILDEVYVYGSFLQSRMYRAGVTCTDCHDPHAAELWTGDDPNAVCAGCHSPDRFSAESHAGHTTDAAGCVDCHMTSRTYMVNDERRDHSFRVPRPDLSAALGTPNACNGCHADETAEWATAAMRAQHGPAVFDRPEFASAFHAARHGNANEALVAIASSPEMPGIARATAIAELGAPLGRDDVGAIVSGLSDPDPLLRIAALRQLSRFPPDYRADIGVAHLSDDVRSVRIEAALAMAAARPLLTGKALSDFDAAAEEFRAARQMIGNRPEAHTALGDFALSLGKLDEAEAHYRQALSLDPRFTPARANLVDAFRARGDDAAGRELLEVGLELDPEDAGLHHALGLLLVRSGDAVEGVKSLVRAAEIEPGDERYAYVAGVGLNSTGDSDAARAWLAAAWQRFPGSYDIGWALATMARDAGDDDAALRYVEALLAGFPDDQNLKALEADLHRD